MDAAGAIIRHEAALLGFSRVRFARVPPPDSEAPGIAAFDRFLAEGRHGDMGYLARGRAPRADPRRLLPDARTALVFGIDYAWPRPPDPGGLTGKVSCYAWGRDYHNLAGKRLRRLGERLRARIPGLGWYAGVDSRPLIERAWAAEAGLAFIGKNCCAIVPGDTSYLFLAVALVDVELEPDRRIPDLRTHCGRCRRCLDVCPTAAFSGPGELDARRCIAYHTIENRGAIPEELRPGLGRWVFGCDLCQEVCPHNGEPRGQERDLAPRPEHAWLDLEWVLGAEDDALDRHFLGSPIRRARPDGLKRNACVVLGNLGDPAARPALMRAEEHRSAVIREHARWALERV